MLKAENLREIPPQLSAEELLKRLYMDAFDFSPEKIAAMRTRTSSDAKLIETAQNFFTNPLLENDPVARWVFQKDSLALFSSADDLEQKLAEQSASTATETAELATLFWLFGQATRSLLAFAPRLHAVTKKIAPRLVLAQGSEPKLYYQPIKHWHIIELSAQWREELQEKNLDEEALLLYSLEMVGDLLHELLHALVFELLGMLHEGLDDEAILGRYQKEPALASSNIFEVFLEGISLVAEMEYYREIVRHNPEESAAFNRATQIRLAYISQYSEDEKKALQADGASLATTRDNNYFLGLKWAKGLRNAGWELNDLQELLNAFKQACMEVFDLETFDYDTLRAVPASYDPDSLFMQCIKRTNEIVGRASGRAVAAPELQQETEFA